MTLLSICIPTYNRSRYLSDLLSCILEQEDQDIEVVVSDNASTDNTPDVIEKYRSKFSNFIYVRQSKNMGYDLNFLSAINNASGKYVWLIGDDDAIESNGIKCVKESLDGMQDVAGLEVGVVIYDTNMQRVLGRRSLSEDGYLYGFKEILEATISHIGYISGHVIRKKYWDGIVQAYPVSDYIGTYYIHVYILILIMKKYKKWGFLNNTCIRYRSDNDSVLSSDVDWEKRLIIDINGYDRIIKDTVGNNYIIRNIRKKIITSIIIGRIKDAKRKNIFRNRSKVLLKTLFSSYKLCPSFYYKLIPIYILNYRISKIIYRIINRRY